MTEYWNTEYSDICEGVIFKIKQVNPIELINLVTASVDYEKTTWDKQQEFVKNALKQVTWTKNGTEWFPLISEDGLPRLPEMQNNPTIGFDLFFAIRRDVILPVFIESKTFQHLTADKKDHKSRK